MTTLNDIRIALESHLNGFMPNPPPIAWPNVRYTPTPGETFIRAEFLPVSRRPVVAGPDPEQRFDGLLYLTVFIPSEQGAEQGIEIADALMERFNGSSAIVSPNGIVRLAYSEAKMPLQDPPFWAIPVEIGWYAYAS
jgi:hypothetical protein